jgi:hypothetical protein
VITKSCVVCGEEFTAPNNVRILCYSTECLNRRKRTLKGFADIVKPRPCAYCGTEFLPRNDNGRFCKNQCMWALHNEANNAKRKEEREKRKVAARLDPNRLPCLDCAHWKPMVGAELGGYCHVERRRTCKPLNPGVKPYAPRKVAANG